MKSLLVTCHPERRSFGGAMADVIQDSLESLGHEVRRLDLHEEGFDPVIRQRHFPLRLDPERFEIMSEQAHQAEVGEMAEDVANSQSLLRWSDNLVIQFPLWWWSLPAQLKGWVDRVFSAGFAYGGSSLAGRRAMLAVTAETKRERFAVQDAGHPLHHIERGILKFSGFTVLPSFVAADIHAISETERRQLLVRLQAHIAECFCPCGIGESV